jgi:hypothetical protein
MRDPNAPLRPSHRLLQYGTGKKAYRALRRPLLKDKVYRCRQLVLMER